MSTFQLPHVPPDEAPIKRGLPAEVERYAPPRRSSRTEPSAEAAQQSKASSFSTATDLHRFLEKRSRQLGTAISILEQQRQHLRSVEKQRDVIHKELAAAVETVNESARLVKSATADSKPSSELDQLLENNRKALDQLESVAVSLISNFQIWRSTWEQYLETCARAKDLKAEMAATEPLIDA